MTEVDTISSSSLEKGMHVEINPQTDRTRKKVISGVVAEILTKSENHPHGILVELDSGEKGRVKRILENPLKEDIAKTNQISIENNTLIHTSINSGESHSVEFKSSVLWSSKFTKEDILNHKPPSKDLHTYGKNTSKIIIAKTISSFLNTDGGILIIGVQENKEQGNDEVIGIEVEFDKLKDPCVDGYRRMLVDVIKDYFPSHIFNHLNEYIEITFEKIDNKVVCGVISSKSDQEVFLMINGTDHFYIRTDASSRELHGRDITNYCFKRFIK
jgi:uncharacterized repeat protein (TIGR03833 family)